MFNMMHQQKTNLQQKQKLSMTNELKQSLIILGYSLDELSQFINEFILENPLIEVENNLDDVILSEGNAMVNFNNKDSNYFDQLPEEKQSFLVYLVEQIHMNYRDTAIRKTMLSLVQHIDSDGYLRHEINETNFENKQSYLEYLDALTLLQTLEPAGVGARNLQECLMLQVERDQYSPNMAYLILEENFEAFVNKKWKIIAKNYDLNLTDVQDIFDYVNTLNPKPGEDFGVNVKSTYIFPELRVVNSNNDLNIYNLKNGMPELVFQEKYYEELTKKDDQELGNYLKVKKQEYLWLKSALTYRNETVLKVGIEIVNKQKDFFKEKTRIIKPLTLKEISKKLGIHESTVSRAINGKYLETSFGVFELKYFFSKKIETTGDSEGASAKQVQFELEKIVSEENKSKPLSDQKIVEKLADKGILISRRTVAKYRDILNIKSSTARKRFD